MVTFDLLNEQNHKISELINVLEVLIRDRGSLDSQVVSEIFFRFVDTVKEHLSLEDHSVYTCLITHRDSDINNTAKLFMSGASEIRRIFDKYVRTWTRKKRLYVGDHDQFIEETGEVFDIVLNRVQDESEKLYPLLRKIEDCGIQ